MEDEQPLWVFILKVVFHGSPLIGILLQKYFLCLALLLLVALPYIKVSKLTLQADDSRNPGEKEKLKSAADRWRLFTFQKP